MEELSLIERAKKVHSKWGRPPATDFYSSETLDLALEYLKGKVTGSQICQVMGLGSGQGYNWCTKIVMKGLRSGDIVVVKPPKGEGS